MSGDYFYTPFQSLSSVRQDAKPSSTSPLSRQISGFRTPFESLILPWAKVLGSYTGTTEVVFSFDNRPILVDLQESTWRPVAVSAGLPHSQLATAISVAGSTKPDQWALLLQYDEAARNLVLSCADSVSEKVLEDLEKSLKSRLRESNGSENSSHPDYSTIDGPSLSIVNPKPKLIDGPSFLHHLVDFQTNAEKLAIDYEGANRTKRQMSYRQVDELSNALATRIVEIIGSTGDEEANDVIPLMIPQSPELYLSCFAILKAGFAFCPLNLDAPIERIKLIADDTKAMIILTTKAYEEQLKLMSRRVKILVVDEPSPKTRTSESKLHLLKDSEKLAYVMYTSGSSGTPKGVGISHRAATQALLAHEEHVPQFKRFLQFAAPTFDVSVFESFFPLVRGCTLVCCAREEMLGDLPEVMRRQRIDASELTPTVAGTLLKNRGAVPSLRTLLTIGEMLTRNVVDEFGYSGVEDGVLHGMYGPTEATIHCTIVPKFDRKLRVGVIGVPFSTVSVFILSIPDEATSASDTTILPQGAVGELALGGHQLANEYINRPEQTKAAFVHLQGYGRVYRTGDKARLNADGLFECLGRISDGQVKLRGQRVELGEIENVVYKHKGISHAMASVLDGTLVLFCLIRSDEITVGELKNLYKRWLPGFMRPNETVLLRDAPRLPSGKLDRKAIERDYTAARPQSAPSESAYLNNVERTIAQVVMKEIGAYPTRTESLIACGLNSLQAIKVTSRLRNRNILLSVADLLSADTIAQVAAVKKDTESIQSDHKRSDLINSIKSLIQQGSNQLLTNPEVDTVLPCTPLQLAMLSETARTASINVNRIDVKFTRHVTFTDVKTALQKFALRNNIMRSGFVPVAIRYPFVRIVWHRLQDSQFYSHIPKENRLCEIRSSMSLMHPFQVFLEESTSRAVFLIHHALYDQWSWDLFASDLKNLLAGQSLVNRPPFDKVAQYFITYPEDRDYHAAEDYWREQLHEVPTASFPCLHNIKSDSQGTAYVSRKLSLTAEELDKSTQALRVSRPALITAAYSLLLGAYVGSMDIVFGMVSSGRSLPIDDVEQIVGPCISTLPLRADISNVRSVRDLIALIHRTSRDLLRHGALPLQRIQQLLTNPRSPRLFDALFVWQESLFTNNTQEPIFTVIDSTDYLDFTLLLEVEPVADTLMAKASFQRSILPEEQAEIFMEQLDQVVTVFANFTEIGLDEVYQNLPQKQLSVEGQIVRKASETLPDTKSLDSIVVIPNGTANKMNHSQQSSGAWNIFSEAPQRIAIDFLEDYDVESHRTKSTTVTFEELEDNAISMACLLLDSGVKPGELVGILMEKSVELYVSILAVLKSGAGYLPVDPKNPSERICSALAEADVRCIIASPSLQIKLKSLSARHSILNPLPGFRSKKTKTLSPHSRLPSYVDPDCPAYAISTSGTTGVPKTVVVSRGNILSNLDVLSGTYPFTSQSRYLQSCSQAFDVSVFDILFAFRNGLCLCAATNDVLFRDLGGIIRSLRITHLSMTSSIAAMIEPNQVPTVSCLVTAGEMLSSKVLKAWAERGLYQGYGPSETTNICTLRPNMQANDLPNNIGYPLPNTSIFISSPDKFMPLPRGAVGELCVGGEQVFQGYMKRSELMSQKVIQNSQWGRVYRTGDIARVLTDGSFCFLGRLDDQLKIRGQRIELSEIDHAILQISEVKNCTTLLVGHESSELPVLVSFYTLGEAKSDQPIDSRVSETLNEKLPPYMVPNDLILLDTIPITETGKIDRKALTERFRTDFSSRRSILSQENTQDSVRESFTKLEGSLRDLLSQVTGTPIPLIRRDTSLFRLGLDSINSVLLSAKIRERFLVQIDLSIILKNPSIKRLAELVQAKRSNSRKEAKKSIEPSRRISQDQTSSFWNVFDAHSLQLVRQNVKVLGIEVCKILPCTPLQETMLSERNDAQHCPANSYENTITFNVFIEEDHLKTAWAQAVKRHQILRTGFIPTNNARFAFAQIVLKNFDLPWQKQSWSLDILDSSAIQDIDRISQGDFIAPPYSLIFEGQKLGRNHSQLTFSVHHALYDAEAMSIILNDIQTLAQNQTPMPFTPFDHYVRYMAELDLNETDLFWQHQLAEFRPCPLFANNNDQFLGKGRRDQKSYQHCSTVSLKDIKDAAKKLGVTISCVYQAAWARFLIAATDSSDVCFGNVYSGRNIPIDGASAVNGPCFNTLPVRVVLQTNETNEILAQKLHSINLSVLPFQPSSLRRIQNRQSGREALFDTLLLVQNEELTLDSQVWQIESECGDMDFPLIWELKPDHSHDSLTVTLHCYSSLFFNSDAKLLFGCFDTLLQDTCLYPSSLASPSLQFRNDVPQVISHSRRDRQKQLQENHSFRSTEDRVVNQSGWAKEDEVARDIVSKLAGVGVSRISPWTTIFGLGLDSINAFQIVAALRKAGYDVSAADLLEAASIANIGQLMRQTPQKPSLIPRFDFPRFEDRYLDRIEHELGIAKDQIEALRPCTPTQCGILSHFIQSRGGLYFNKMSWMLQEGTDLAKIKGAWIETTKRHEILRTGFVGLDDPKYPFAMLTYSEQSQHDPWISSLSDFVTPEQIHVPPWHLELVHKGRDIVVRLTMLHALYDATALEQILTDVSMLYRGYELPPPRSILPSIANFLDQDLGESDDVRTFWRLYGETFQPTKFPNLRPFNVSDTTFISVSRFCSLSYTRLVEGCQALDTSLQIAGQCAWARLLSAVIGEPRVTFGLLLSGRSANDIKEGPVVFPCVNTLPLSVDVVGNTKELLRILGDRTVSLMKRQNTSLPKVKKLAEVEGDIFDSIFVYQKTLKEGEHIRPPWQLIEEEATAEYAVSIELIPHENDMLKVQATFRSDLVPKEQAQLLLDQLQDTLIDSIFCPDRECRSFEFLRPSNLSHISAKEERIQSPIRLLHEFVEQSAKRFPERIALEFAMDLNDHHIEKLTWTYKELNEEGNRIANLILQQDVSLGSLVAICFDKCPEASFSILGVLKAGCAFVPLDATSPPARKHFIIEDTACQIILTTTEKLDEFQGLSHSRAIAVDRELELGTLSSEIVLLERPISPDDVCYCLFTSGSTGTPKGCEITHDNVVQAMLAFQRLFKGRWDAESRWLQFASFHFDVSVLEQYWSWSVGICVTSAPRDILLEDLSGAMQKLQITHVDLTPSLARLIHPEDVPSLCQGVFITGGEQLHQEILETWGDRGVIHNGYGPTEATIGCTMLTRVPKLAKTSNIGPQFDNVGSYILHPESGETVPRGAVGELCVSGPLVGRGYHNRDELTAQKFEDSSKFNRKIYHTGDLVRLLHNGDFDFLTRVDDQVKLRGQRLEIGEINHVLQQASKKIKELATLVLKHPQQPKEQLVSFAAVNRPAERAGSPTLLAGEKYEDLRRRLYSSAVERLPSYMVPTNFLILDFIPLSASNKVDVKSLKAFYGRLSIESLQDVARKNNSSTEVESSVLETLLRVSRRFTNAEEITPQSSIFKLGIDSISAISLTRALKSEGLDIGPATMMRYSTIETLASCLLNDRSRDSLFNAQHLARQRIIAFGHKHLSTVLEKLQVRPEDVERVSPCTPLQEGIIFKTLESKETFYFSLFAFDLQHSVNLVQLEKAWNFVAHENEILRTQFVLTDDGYAQVVMRGLDGPDGGLISKKAIVNEGNSKAPFEDNHREWTQRHRNLEGKLWNVWIGERETTSVMCVQMFHALYDGISLSNLLDSVARNYLAMPKQSKCPEFHEILPLGPLSKIEGAREHWTAQLKQSVLLGLSRPSASDSSPVTIVSHFSNAKAIQSLRSRLSVTEPAIFLACWLLALQRHFKCIPTVGLVLSGRALNVEGIEHVTGPMFNTVPAHIDLSNDCSISDFIVLCHSYHVSSMQYQHTPLRDIIKWLSGRQQNVAFDSLFVFQKERMEEEVCEKPWSLAFSNSCTEYPLALEVQQERDETISLTLNVNAVGVSRAVASQLIKCVEEFFQIAALDPGFRVPAARNASLPQPSETSGIQEERIIDEASEPFEWSNEALKIRDEIAFLTDLGVENIRNDVSILELGLDSIDAIRLSARLKKAGIRLSVSQILRDRTIRNMATNSSISSLMVHAAESDSYSLHEESHRLVLALENQGVNISIFEEILPTTGLQEGMISKMLSSDFDEYYNHDVLELTLDVDWNALQQIWGQVIEVNAILRTKFIQIDDATSPFSFAQAVCFPSRLEWEPVQISAESEIPTLIRQIVMDARSAALEASMFRLTPVLYREKRFVIMTAAHAIFDGYSMALIHDDVARLSAGQQLEDRPHYRTALEKILRSQAPNTSHFWSSQLSGLSPTVLSADDPPRSRTLRQEKKSEIQATQFLSFCRSQDVTPQTVGILCWLATLAWYTRKLDVCFGLVLSGRDTEGSEKTVFPMMNTVPFRAVLHGTSSEMLQYIQELSAKIAEAQHYPLRKVLRSAERSSSDLFNTLFIYQKQPSGSAERPLPYRSVGGSSKTQYPINVELETVNGDVMWRIAYQEWIPGDLLLRNMGRVLKSIIEHSNDSIYMMSGSSVMIGELPSFKQKALDREMGRDSSEGRKSRVSNDEESWTEYERIIRSALSATAGVPENSITKYSNLFHLGLDSISAIKVSARLKKQSMKLSVSDMLKAGTVQRMADSVQAVSVPMQDQNNEHAEGSFRQLRPDSLSKSAGFESAEIERVLPATAFQCYALVMCQKSNGRLFNSNFSYKLSHKILPEHLQSAWNLLVRRFQILRTQFISTEQFEPAFTQVVLQRMDSPIAWVDGEQSFERDLNTRGPLVKLFAKTEADMLSIKLRIHHALYDAVSLPMMMSYFESLCNQIDAPAYHSLNFERYVQELSAPASKKAQQQFWTSYLNGAISSVKTGRSSDSLNSERSTYFTPSLLEDITWLQVKAQHIGLSFQALFIMALASAVCNTRPKTNSQGSKEVVLGLYLANRSLDLEEISQLAAPTVNIVPLRVRLPQNLSNRQVAYQIQSDLGEISRMENCGVALHEVARWTGVRVDCTLNFLKLPEAANGNTVERGRITLSKDVDSSQGDWKVSDNCDGEGFLSQYLPPSVADAYSPSLDIEASVTGQGLAVGFFDSRAVSERQDLKDIARSLRSLLNDL